MLDIIMRSEPRPGQREKWLMIFPSTGQKQSRYIHARRKRLDRLSPHYSGPPYK